MHNAQHTHKIIQSYYILHIDRGRGGRDNKANAEQKRLETERKRKEEEEAKAKAEAEEAAKKRQAELDRRSKLQSEYNVSINGAITTLENYSSSSQIHANLRAQLSPNALPGESTSALSQARKDFGKLTDILYIYISICYVYLCVCLY